jgi:hypothetical protein
MALIPLSLLVAFNTTVFAHAVIILAKDFLAIKTILLNDPSPAKTLIAFDDDDTLTMMACKTPSECHYLGGPAWFRWHQVPHLLSTVLV